VDPLQVGLIGLGSFMICVFLGVPVLIAMGTIGLIGFTWIAGFDVAMSYVSTWVFGAFSSPTFAIVALFILMGELVHVAGFGKDGFEVARRWFGHWPGGLAQATVWGSAFYGAISGATMASCVTMGRIAVPEMVREGYDRGLAGASVAASGTLASMIPPSGFLVLYAILVEESIVSMLLAGIIPGILTAVGYSIMIALRVRHTPQLAPHRQQSTWRERWSSLLHAVPLAVIAFTITFGLFLAWFTPTELAAVGVGIVLVAAVLFGRLSLRTLGKSLSEGVRVSVMILALLLSSFLMVAFVARSGLPAGLANALVNLPFSSTGILVCVLAAFIVLGTALENIVILFVVIPIMVPAMHVLGWDLVWFGILFAQVGAIGVVSPPLGLNLFATDAAVGEYVPMTALMRGVLPFILYVDIPLLALMVAFPEIVLFLPGLA
jgi:C4-dicarboxylate transporter DctM subunit